VTLLQILAFKSVPLQAVNAKHVAVAESQYYAEVHAVRTPVLASGAYPEGTWWQVISPAKE